MGIVLWIASGLVAFAAARLVAIGRSSGLLELTAAITVAVIFGIAATLLDFGGWQELDWRAAVFAFTGGAISVPLVRLLGMRGESTSS